MGTLRLDFSGGGFNDSVVEPLYLGGPPYRFGVAGVYSVIGQVPEPATWALMVLGFAAVGYAARRKQRATLRYSSAAL